MDKKEKTVMTEEMNKNYTLRRLKDKDLWPVLDIIGKVFPNELAAVFVDVATGEKSVKEVGAIVTMKLILAVVRNMKSVHDEVYEFLSDVSGLTVEEIEEMEFGTTPAMLWDIVKNEKNNSFFKALSKLS